MIYLIYYRKNAVFKTGMPAMHSSHTSIRNSGSSIPKLRLFFLFLFLFLFAANPGRNFLFYIFNECR